MTTTTNHNTDRALQRFERHGTDQHHAAALASRDGRRVSAVIRANVAAPRHAGRLAYLPGV